MIPMIVVESYEMALQTADSSIACILMTVMCVGVLWYMHWQDLSKFRLSGHKLKLEMEDICLKLDKYYYFMKNI